MVEILARIKQRFHIVSQIRWIPQVYGLLMHLLLALCLMLFFIEILNQIQSFQDFY